MFKLRLLTAAGVAAFLTGAATAQTMPQTTPSPEQAGKPTSDAAAKAAKDEAMRGTQDPSTQDPSIQDPSRRGAQDPSMTAPPAQPATRDQSAQTQPATQQEAAAQPGTSTEGMSERTTRAWSDMNMEETTVGTSRLFTSTVTDASGRQMTIVTNGPVPDNAENRAAFPPLSNKGRRSAARGN